MVDDVRVEGRQVQRCHGLHELEQDNGDDNLVYGRRYVRNNRISMMKSLPCLAWRAGLDC